MTDQVFKTKWGYVPYSYEDYKKLKELNKIFWIARANAAEWNRWHGKDEHNRVKRKWLRNELGQRIGQVIVGPWEEPIVCGLFSQMKWGHYQTDNQIESEYQASHKPVAHAEGCPEPIFSSEEIEELLQKAKIWMENVKPR